MAYPTTSGSRRAGGFTFVELMVVMGIVALLLTIALPRYFDGLQRARESVLREDLTVMRDAIGHYYGDKGAYPPTLDSLVEQRYLRAIPEDPITEQSDSWIMVPPPDFSAGVYDVRSGAEGTAQDGTAYADW